MGVLILGGQGQIKPVKLLKLLTVLRHLAFVLIKTG